MAKEPGTRWANALSQWHKEGGRGHAPHGSPGYEQVAAIYQLWHPEWFPPEARKKGPKNTKQTRIQNHLASLKKLGLVVTHTQPVERKEMPPQPSVAERVLRRKPAPPEPDVVPAEPAENLEAAEPADSPEPEPAEEDPLDEEVAAAMLKRLSPAQLAKALKKVG